MQMERLLAPTRPYNTVLRPGDGRVPERIAYVMCTGSRDETVGNPLCSKFCCMYSIKQNQLIMGALPLADVTVHYIDIRAVGKGYDEFFEQSKAMGATFVKGRDRRDHRDRGGQPGPPLRGHRERRRHRRGRVRPRRARGRRAAEPRRRPLFTVEELALDDADYVDEVDEDVNPGRTSIPGVFVAGAASGAKDIPESILHAGAAVAQAAAHLERKRNGCRHERSEPSERRIGVYVCHCGGNISDYVDVEQVVAAVKDEPGVVVARRAMFTCSDATQQEIIDDIQGQELDGLVVASCSPKLHTFTFRAVAQRAGLNPYEYTQVNIREQCSWTHTDDREGATAQGDPLVRAGIARTRLTEPLEPIVVETTPRALVIGGGVAGMRAAIGLADVGLAVFLVEREAELGGWVGGFGELFPHGKDGRALIAQLAEEIGQRPEITVFTNAELTAKSGTFGNYRAVVHAGGESIQVEVGQIIVATGFDSYEPEAGELGYGIDGVLTLPELKQLLDAGDGPLDVNGKPVESIAYVYCVGSRDAERPYCSRFCCSAAVHASLSAAGRDRDVRQYHLYRDLRTYGGTS